MVKVSDLEVKTIEDVKKVLPRTVKINKYSMEAPLKRDIFPLRIIDENETQIGWVVNSCVGYVNNKFVFKLNVFSK